MRVHGAVPADTAVAAAAGHDVNDASSRRNNSRQGAGSFVIVLVAGEHELDVVSFEDWCERVSNRGDVIRP